MNRTLATLLLTLCIVGAVILIVYDRSKDKSEIRQYYDSDLRLITKSGEGLCTYAWDNGGIVWSSYDDISTITDSLIKVRKEQAESVIKAIRIKKKHYKEIIEKATQP